MCPSHHPSLPYSEYPLSIGLFPGRLPSCRLFEYISKRYLTVGHLVLRVTSSKFLKIHISWHEGYGGYGRDRYGDGMTPHYYCFVFLNLLQYSLLSCITWTRFILFEYFNNLQVKIKPPSCFDSSKKSTSALYFARQTARQLNAARPPPAHWGGDRPTTGRTPPCARSPASALWFVTGNRGHARVSGYAGRAVYSANNNLLLLLELFLSSFVLARALALSQRRQGLGDGEHRGV